MSDWNAKIDKFIPGELVGQDCLYEINDIGKRMNTSAIEEPQTNFKFLSKLLPCRLYI